MERIIINIYGSVPMFLKRKMRTNFFLLLRCPTLYVLLDIIRVTFQCPITDVELKRIKEKISPV